MNCPGSSFKAYSIRPEPVFCGHSVGEFNLDHTPAIGNFGRCTVAQGAVWSPMIVEPSPSLDQFLGLAQVAKLFAVQTLVTQIAVEALQKAVVPGLALVECMRVPPVSRAANALPPRQ